MKYLILLLSIIVFTLSGCQSNNKESRKPYIIGNESIRYDTSNIGSKKPNILNTKESDKNSSKKSINHDKSTKSISEKVAFAEKSRADTKITMTNLEIAHQEKMAMINAEKEKFLKKIELEGVTQDNITKKEIRISELENQATIEKNKQKYNANIIIEKTKLHKQYLLASGLLLLVFFLFLFLIHRRNNMLKIKLHNDKLEHDAKIQESRHYHEKVIKTLDLLADKTTNKSLKKDLVSLLKNDEHRDQKLLEQ